MSGRWLLLTQLETYMKLRKQGKTQVTSAACAGFSERTARKIEQGKRIDPRTQKRHWRTRPDPLGEVWEHEVLAMLNKTPELSALTILEYLQTKYGGEKYTDALLRTLQRRVKHWRHSAGPDKAVIFQQTHMPGRLGLSDFTVLKGIVITIQKKPLIHLLYHFRLMYSGWSNLRVTLGGESFVALSEGLQIALWRLGGVPEEHRTDSLSAAFKNLDVAAADDLTKQYHDLCEHYGMTPTRNNRGVAHENGGIESPHGHLKRRIYQAFLLRGSYDFDTVADYQKWLDEVVSQHNRRNAKTITLEQAALKSLPTHKTAEYTLLPVKVSSSSTIQVRCVLYTVPSRLIGATLQVHLYDKCLRCYLGTECVLILQRVYATGGGLRRTRQVDYRHVIGSLVKKPGAFARSQLRDALLPNDLYRTLWAQLCGCLDIRAASKYMVTLLKLAADNDCEEALGMAIHNQLLLDTLPELEQLKAQFDTRQKLPCPSVQVTQHALVAYNELIGVREVCHG